MARSSFFDGGFYSYNYICQFCANDAQLNISVLYHDIAWFNKMAEKVRITYRAYQSGNFCLLRANDHQ